MKVRLAFMSIDKMVRRNTCPGSSDPYSFLSRRKEGIE
jgi:hypothetical protein